MKFCTKIFQSSLSPVSRIGWSPIRPKRNPWRHLWPTHGRSISLSQSTKAKVLLVNNEERLCRFCSEMWQMPKVHQNDLPTSGATIQLCSSLAIHPMGTWYPRALSTSQSTKKVSNCCLWVLNKMSGSRRYSNNHPEERRKISMGEHYLPIRYSSTNHHRQWSTAERWQNFTILFQPTYCHESLFGMSSVN